jgi:hypothetical protein
LAVLVVQPRNKNPPEVRFPGFAATAGVEPAMIPVTVAGTVPELFVLPPLKVFEYVIVYVLFQIAYNVTFCVIAGSVEPA